MAFPVTLNGRTYTLTDFEGTNYVDGLPDAFEDFVTHAGDIYNSTSTTSNSIGTGSKTFTVEANKPYQAGTPLRIADAAAPSTNFLDTVVTSYSGTTLVVNSIGYGGSGTKTSWTVNIGGAKTVDGTLGLSQGGTGATDAAGARTNIDVYSKADADSRFLNVSGEASAVTISGNLSVDGGTIKLDGNYPTGTQNVALGGDTFTAIESGANYNTAFGYRALEDLTTGDQNTAVGRQALADVTTGSNNTAVGMNAADSTTSGGSNVAVGRDALQANTTASYNTAVGYQAGYSGVTASTVTNIGYQAGYSNTVNNNTFVGAFVGYANTTGAENAVLGGNSVGTGTFYNNTTGSYNTALGTGALGANTTASNNTAVGYQAGYDITTGERNVFVGPYSGANTTVSNRNTFVGMYSGENFNGASGSSNNAFLGYNSGGAITTGTKNTILGSYSGNQSGLDIRTSSNNIVLSDGDGDPLMYYHGGITSPMWFIRNATAGQWNTRFSSEHASNPYGVQVNYLSAAPNGNSNFFFYANDSASVRFFVESDGDVKNYTGVYGATSDLKLKENISDAASQWDDIKAVQVKKYSMKLDALDAPNKLGVIAQDLEASGMSGLVSETVDVDPDGTILETTTKTVKYSILYMKAVKALQEAMDRIETLEAKVTALENA